MAENDYSTLYKTWPTARLLEIVDNARQFQPSAVEAAQREIASRELSNEQLDTERLDEAERQKQFDSHTRSTLAIADKFKSFVLSFGRILSPAQNDASIDNSIKLVLIFLGIIFLVEIYGDIGLISYLMSDRPGKWDFSLFYYHSWLFILPPAGYLLTQRKKAGWILTTFFFSLRTSEELIFLRSTIKWMLEDDGLISDLLFPILVSPGTVLGTALIFGASIWPMTNGNFRKVFNVNKETMYITLAAGAIIAVLSWAIMQAQLHSRF